MEHEIELGELPLAKLRSFSNEIEGDVLESLTLEQTLGSKSLAGGTAPERVAEALRSARGLLLTRA